MLLLRGNSDLASNPTEVLAVSTPAWLAGATMDPEPTIFSDIPHSPFNTDTSQCVLPVASSMGTAVSPRLNGGRLPSSPHSAIGTSSTHTHTQAGRLQGSKALCFSFTPISCPVLSPRNICTHFCHIISRFTFLSGSYRPMGLLRALCPVNRNHGD